MEEGQTGEKPVLIARRRAPQSARKRVEQEEVEGETDEPITKIMRRDKLEEPSSPTTITDKLELQYEATTTAAKDSSAYQDYLQHQPQSKDDGMTKIRNTCRFDYAPDLCKDYNETGFCGFGDSCKFLHDRGDYKSGWELDDEWEEQQRRRRRHGLDKQEDYTVKPTLPEVPIIPPTICDICNEEFHRPIVETKCGHLFCERCALAHSRRDKKCPTCGTTIDGTFKVYKPNKR